MTRRNIELMLLLIASPIVIVLFAMMVVTGGQELSFNTLGVPLGIFAAFLVAHIAVRLLAPAADPAILPISFAPRSPSCATWTSSPITSTRS